MLLLGLSTMPPTNSKPFMSGMYGILLSYLHHDLSFLQESYMVHMKDGDRPCQSVR